MTDSKTWPCSMQSLFTVFLDPIKCTTWYFEGLNPIPHLVSHADKMLRSFCSVVLSSSLSIVRYKAVAYHQQTVVLGSRPLMLCKVYTLTRVSLITPGHPRIPQDTPGHIKILKDTFIRSFLQCF